jgi:hypothetical protein
MIELKVFDDGSRYWYLNGQLHKEDGPAIENAEGKSELNSITEREGLVFKCIQNANFSFKAISNKFLLKEK